uniref:Uncharacterized protein n=1 Tax=Romanomermis culicivorax TaxID=13658 RepID=A0A915JWE1_ROMCU
MRNSVARAQSCVAGPKGKTSSALRAKTMGTNLGKNFWIVSYSRCILRVIELKTVEIFRRFAPDFSYLIVIPMRGQIDDADYEYAIVLRAIKNIDQKTLTIEQCYEFSLQKHSEDQQKTKKK